MIIRIVSTFLLASTYAVTMALAQTAPTTLASTVKKVKDVVVYRDDTFHSAFPSIVRRDDGALLVAFRRAPDPRNFGDRGVTHTDPCAQLVLVRSTDDGESWTPTPKLIFAHPRGGLQDPCLLALDDGSMLCASYAWALIPATAGQKLKGPSRLGDFVFMGGVMLRSTDGGERWDQLPLPPTRGERRLGPFNEPVPAYNRGPMCQGRDGRVFWVTATENAPPMTGTGTHLMISNDRGTTWSYSCPVAVDAKASFSEAAIYETPAGDLVAFMRTANLDDRTAVARSTDGGRSFHQWRDAGFQGHPHHALRLPDGRVLLVYGYRHKPFGLRARVLDAECTNFATAPEIVLRDDGGNGDLGYPWSVMTSQHRALVVYYFNQNDATRYIAGTILDVGRSP
jgi:sialidase-1